MDLTAGTPFMEYVDNIILNFLEKQTNLQTFYSASTIKNEGELKLFEWLIKSNIKKNVGIYGNDADLIILALNCKLNNIYIINNYKYISIRKLVINLSNIIKNKFGLSNHPVRKDFVLLSMLVGNDYLPRVCNFVKLWDSYKKLQKNNNNFLINKKQNINFINLKKLFKLLDPIYNKKSSKQQVLDYLKSLIWNFKLYSNNIYPNFITTNYRIDIKSLIQYIPNNLYYNFGSKKLDRYKNLSFINNTSYRKEIFATRFTTFIGR